MPREFCLTQRICGFALNSASKGENIQISTQELIGPADPLLLGRLEELHKVIFSLIPDCPPPSIIDNLLVLIRQDLAATAYINELRMQIMVRVNRAIEAGSQVFRDDVSDVTGVDLGVEVPADNGLILVRSSGWRRSLFFDLGPLTSGSPKRAEPLEKVLVQQELLLLGLTPPASMLAAETK